jgi:hypothetical protein
LALAHNALVWLNKTLYLIFKFAVPHRQSLDDDIGDVWNTETHRPCGKQTLPNLEFVHDAPLHKKIKHRERITFKGETKIGAPSSCTEGVPFFDNGAFVYW